MAVFDNNQVLQRRWHISTNNTVVSSTITMVAFIEIPFVNLMYSPELTPGQWMWLNFPANGEYLLQRREQDGRNLLYSLHFHPWLAGIIEEVARDQQFSDGKFSDSVDSDGADRKHSAHYKTCPNCGDRDIPEEKSSVPKLQHHCHSCPAQSCTGAWGKFASCDRGMRR